MKEPPRCFENSILISATATTVERCITELDLMTRWLNPMLSCEPEDGTWSTEVGSKSKFVVMIPVLKFGLQPTLHNIVSDRALGLIVWDFEGFFVGTDRWQCDPVDHPLGDAVGDLVSSQSPLATRLTNCFTFEIPNPLVRFGFNKFASSLTQTDMIAQLKRIKVVAEQLQRT
jgi:hypothetical protein